MFRELSSYRESLETKTSKKLYRFITVASRSKQRATILYSLEHITLALVSHWHVLLFCHVIDCMCVCKLANDQHQHFLLIFHTAMRRLLNQRVHLRDDLW
jgi:hypothetical protein